jgi:hypothetical protein
VANGLFRCQIYFIYEFYGFKKKERKKMPIKTVKFPFTSFNEIDAHYSLELQGYVGGFLNDFIFF